MGKDRPVEARRRLVDVALEVCLKTAAWAKPAPAIFYSQRAGKNTAVAMRAPAMALDDRDEDGIDGDISAGVR